jgi:transposase
MTAGQVSDYTGAATLLGSLPKAEWLLTDRGYVADWFRDALKDKGIKPCITGRKSRGKPVKHDKRRNRIEIMFGRLKEWQWVATRYDRCPKVFLSTIASPQPSCSGYGARNSDPSLRATRPPCRP